MKTLEEPPPHILFIFATTEIHKVPATILSRCQRYDFRRISIEEIVGRLSFIAKEENISIDSDSLLIIAKKGDGSMRDSQSIFDQVVAFCGTTITLKDVSHALNIVDQELFFKFSDAIKINDTKLGLELVDDVVKSGYDIKEFVGGLAEHFRNMVIAKTTNSTHLIEESEAYRKRYLADTEEILLPDLLRIIKIISDTENVLKYSVQPRFKLEMMMVQLTKMEQTVKIDELLGQLDDMKKKVHFGSSSVSSASTSIQTSEKKSSVTYPTPSSIAESKPAYSVSFVSQKSNGNSVQQKAENVSQTTAVPASVILIDEVQKEWNTIVDELRKKRISVGTVLGESKPAEIINGTLRIATIDEFHRSTISRNKDFLAEQINSMLNSKFRIEPFIGDIGFNSVSGGGRNENVMGTPSKPAVNEDHPLIKTLYKDFGAERI